MKKALAVLGMVLGALGALVAGGGLTEQAGRAWTVHVHADDVDLAGRAWTVMSSNRG